VGAASKPPKSSSKLSPDIFEILVQVLTQLLFLLVELFLMHLSGSRNCRLSALL